MILLSFTIRHVLLRRSGPRHHCQTDKRSFISVVMKVLGSGVTIKSESPTMTKLDLHVSESGEHSPFPRDYNYWRFLLSRVSHA